MYGPELIGVVVHPLRTDAETFGDLLHREVLIELRRSPVLPGGLKAHLYDGLHPSEFPKYIRNLVDFDFVDQ